MATYNPFPTTSVASYEVISDIFPDFKSWFEKTYQKEGLTLESQLVYSQKIEVIEAYYNFAYPNGLPVDYLKGTAVKVSVLSVKSPAKAQSIPIHQILRPNDTNNFALICYGSTIFSLATWSDTLIYYENDKDMADDFLSYISTKENQFTTKAGMKRLSLRTIIEPLIATNDDAEYQKYERVQTNI